MLRCNSERNHTQSVDGVSNLLTTVYVVSVQQPVRRPFTRQHSPTDTTYLLCFQALLGPAHALLSLIRFPDSVVLLRMQSYRLSHSLTCSAQVPKQEDFRTFLMSEECAEMAEMAVNLA